ncbi:MAG TPA: hypothetical protein VG893_05910 [Terracidiphilus sp.]|nr:hypothetical protein [Terracidiphilus sp.]
MKQLGWIVLAALIAAPAWGARAITVAELRETLASMHKAGKSDEEVADALKQVELSEQLTRSTMNSMVDDVPGRLSTEQIYVLEARSALLPPPPSDIPTAAAPDAAAQKTMLDKAASYVSKTYTQLPALTATKTTIRFQDNIEATAASSGLHSGARDATNGSGIVSPFQFVHYINSTDSEVASNHGAELEPKEKDKTPWGANRMIAVETPDPSLGTVFDEAQAAGEIKWVRWQLVNDKQTAVYSFNVPKKKGKMEVNVCCFPDVTQAGMASFTSASLTGTGGAKGNFQTATSWHNYKSSLPYHGELFIDPGTGIVVRMIVQDETKKSDEVHQLDERVDYGPATVDGKQLVVPMRTVTLTQVVPNGDSGSAGAYSERNTFFTTEYKNYAASK